MADNDNHDSHIFDKLQQIGQEFNTNKGFGLMGMIDNEDPQAAPRHQEPPAAQALAPEALDSQIFERIAPLNDTLQAMNQRFSKLEEKLQTPAPARTELPAPVAPPDLNPEQQKLWELEQRANRADRDYAYEKAANALNRVRLTHPDVDLSDNDLTSLWQQQRFDDNVQMAKNANWDQHWELMAKAKRTPRLEQQLKTMEAELSSLKSNRNNPINDMASIPQPRRAAGPSQSINNDGIDEEVYREASKGMGRGRFMGFNKALFAAQNSRSLRGVS